LILSYDTISINTNEATIYDNRKNTQAGCLNFREISSATASRDLQFAVEKGILEKSGFKNSTKYKFI
jgi:Fic family protein